MHLEKITVTTLIHVIKTMFLLDYPMVYKKGRTMCCHIGGDRTCSEDSNSKMAAKNIYMN